MKTIMRQSFVVNGLNPLLVALVVLACVIGSASSKGVMDRPEASPAVTKPLYDFSGKLLLALNKQDAKSNLILSPVSIHQALSMVLLGSDSESQTRREFLDAIGYSNLSDVQIEQCHQSYSSIMREFEKITNETRAGRQRFEAEKKNNNDEERYFGSKASPRSPVLDLFTMMITKNRGQARPEYENDIKRYFRALLSSIDDEKPETKTNLMKKLNDWGKEAGFDSPILDQSYLDDKFEALLIAAIQVEAFWFDDFHEGSGENIFHNFGFKDKPVNGKFLGSRDHGNSRYIEFTSSERARAKSLHQAMSKDETFKQLVDLNFRAVKLGLQGDLTFTILEPMDDSAESSSTATPNAKLNKLIGDLFSDHGASENQPKSTKLDKVLDLLDHSYDASRPDYVKLPKFKFESDIDLKSSLQSLGIKRGFNRELAEISNVTMNKLFIGDVKHKALIEATKTGIKAAGITMIKMMLMSAPMTLGERVEVIIENPFMFVLRYRDIPLFVGRLTNLPKVGSS